MCDIHPFYWNVYTKLGYLQTGRKGNDNRFLMDLSLTHIFIKDDHNLDKNIVSKLYPMIFYRDISFWLSKHWDQYIKQHTFDEFVYDILGDYDDDVVFKVEFLNEFEHKQTGKKIKTFRIWYLEKDKAFNRYKCNDLQSKLRDALRDKLNVGVANNPNQQK